LIKNGSLFDILEASGSAFGVLDEPGPDSLVIWLENTKQRNHENPIGDSQENIPVGLRVWLVMAWVLLAMPLVMLRSLDRSPKSKVASPAQLGTKRGIYRAGVLEVSLKQFPPTVRSGAK
jgi:hypothetical protein